MPSTEEAFGVAYVEAMAAGVPAIGCRGEPGPEEIAAAGDGFVLVPPGDIERLSQRIDELLSDPQRLREAGQRARATVAANFTWERCGQQTLAAYLRRALLEARPVRHRHAPAYRVGALTACTSVEDIELACSAAPPLHGGRHGTRGELSFPHRAVAPCAACALAASGRYRAVVCPTGGRLAPAGGVGRRAPRRCPADPLGVAVGAPASPPRTPLSYLPLRRLYRTADAVVTYGPHVSAYVTARGARNVHVAPQSVDNDFWREPACRARRPRREPRREVPVRGTPSAGEGAGRAPRAWRASGLGTAGAALVLVGSNAAESRPRAPGTLPACRRGPDARDICGL